MSWEAFRLTSKSPAELYVVMGPNGVDALVRQALQECWTTLPEEMRTFANWQRRASETFARNRKVWAAIKKPAPAAFFENLAPHPSDGHLRQAMILCWMMMPRAGGRDFKAVVKLMDAIFERSMESWKQDSARFTGAPAKRAKTIEKIVKKVAKNAKKTSAKKR